MAHTKPFIGSWSTKRAGNKRVDIEIINLSPQGQEIGGQPKRMCLQAFATQLGQIVVERQLPDESWVAQGIPLPFDVYDRGIFTHPHAPLLMNQIHAANNQVMIQTNWTHNYTVTLSQQALYAFKKERKRKPGQDEDPPPFYFKTLHVRQQIQSSTQADDMLEGECIWLLPSLLYIQYFIRMVIALVKLGIFRIIIFWIQLFSSSFDCVQWNVDLGGFLSTNPLISSLSRLWLGTVPPL